ncbi:hypothetical protein ABZ557_28225 [Streptomyces sp. NPDC019645]|uniref:hypothetical protein n=1 Tax=Streptomyces sp. NPDC019645 TaxID=3154786 RepID=UPI0033D904E6
MNLKQSSAGRDTALSVDGTTIGAVEARLAALEGEGLVRAADDEREAIRLLTTDAARTGEVGPSGPQNWAGFAFQMASRPLPA